MNKEQLTLVLQAFFDDSISRTSAWLAYCNFKNLLNAIEISLNNFDKGRLTVNDYNLDNVSNKVVKIITSYIPYVNEKVWFKKNS